MTNIDFDYHKIAHMGNNVSHAKNRNKRPFKRNLHTVTIKINGQRKQFKVPTKVLRMLKKAGVTTHWKKPDDDNN